MLMLKLRFNVALVFKKEALNENKYKELLEKIQLTFGAVLDNRIVMSPMLVFGSIQDGTVSEDDLNYFDKRSKVAGMLVTGAMFVSDAGHGANHYLLQRFFLNLSNKRV